MTAATTATDPRVESCMRFLKDLLNRVRPRDFTIRCWDGATWEPDAGQVARFTWVITHPGSVRNMFWPPKPNSIGEAFVFGEFEIEGDFAAFCEVLARLDTVYDTLTLLQKLRLGWQLWWLPRVDQPRMGRPPSQLSGGLHSRARDRQAISFHYDQSNEFFASFLGPEMVYTCAIFADANEPLAVAENRQFELICRKLRLKPGERLLDIGCGWGGLVVYAAKHYGVHAVGVTLSERQAEWARDKIRAEGIEGRCRIDLIDYRDIDERQAFDKITTIEAMEHFGASQFAAYFQKCWRVLRPQGSMLVQQITLKDPAVLTPSTRAQIQAFIFPDGQLVSVPYTLSEAEKAGFEVRDVESFREHYVLTLDHWLHTLETRRDDAIRAIDEAAYRNFRLFLAGARRMFAQNLHNLHQMLFAKSHPAESGYPLDCHDWYTNELQGVASRDWRVDQRAARQ